MLHSKNQYINMINANQEIQKSLRLDNGMVYHFTNISALNNMVSSSTLWATNCCYLNDRREVKRLFNYARQKLNAFYKEKAHKPNDDFDMFINFEKYTLDRIFIVSFSTKVESIPMWEIYSSSDGVCIGLDQNEIFNEFLSIINNDPGDIAIQFLKVLYDSHILENLIDEIIEAHKIVMEGLLDGEYESEKERLDVLTKELAHVSSAVIQISSMLKNDEFAYENEMRAIIVKDSLENLKFRQRDDDLIPYIQLKLSNLPIKEVIVSSKNKSEIIVQGLGWLLKHNKYEDVNVRIHETDYR